MYDRDQDFFGEDYGEVLARYEDLVAQNRSGYFDVHEYEQIFDHYYTLNSFTEAESMLQNALEQHPDSTSLLIKKGQILIQKGDSAQALDLAAFLGNIETNNETLWMIRGSAYLIEKMPEKAMESFMKAFEISGRDEDLGLNIAATFERIGEYHKSIHFLLRLIEDDPESEQVWWEIATCYEYTGQYDKAIKSYQKFVDLQPFSESGWFNLGVLYNQKEIYDQAIHAFENVLAIDPEFYTALFNIGNALANLEKHKEAISVYLEFLSTDPGHAQTFYYIGESYDSLNEYEQAFDYFLKATKANPNFADAWYGLAGIRFEQANPYEALYFIGRALKLQDDVAEFFLLQGLIYDSLEFFEDAIKSVEQALALEPDNEEAIEKLTEINQKISLHE